MILKDFGKTLRQLRRQYSETQTALGKVLEISQSTVAMYENGKREPDFEMLEKIADHFNVDMNYLTGWTEKEVVQELRKNELDHSEEILLGNFRSLNDEGQEKLLDYSNDLIDTGRYIKSDSNAALDQEA